MARLGKRERHVLRDQYNLVKSAKKQLVADNLANIKALPTSKGYRLSPDMKQGFIFTDPSNLGRYNRFGSDSSPVGKAPSLPSGTGSWRK
jgi:hypothetical protein